jgi:Fe-Mn family superoxide dismutase
MTKYQLPPLPYDFSALEPVISGAIMELHYTKHHQAYVNNLNAAVEKYAAAESKNDIAAMVSLQAALRFNGGGHINHSIFWTNLAPKEKGGGEGPSGDLKKAVESEFGSIEKFIETMSATTLAIQGSGWGWLGYHKERQRLVIATCANQDPLCMTGLVPLLGLDVWEHAYYLQYKSARADYLKNIWQVVNWKNVEQRYQEVKTH